MTLKLNDFKQTFKVETDVFTHAYGSRGVGFTKLDIEIFYDHTMSPGNQFILESEVKVTSHRKQFRLRFLHSCVCWLLL